MALAPLAGMAGRLAGGGVGVRRHAVRVAAVPGLGQVVGERDQAVGHVAFRMESGARSRAVTRCAGALGDERGHGARTGMARLRALAPDTKALYREAAATLFFRFGIAPTANRLHQLVGKGSMATSAAALSAFWKDLREQARLRIEHPAVPETLRETAGALIGQFWKVAHSTAEADLASVREELEVRVHAAELSAADSQARLERANLHLEAQSAELAKMQAMVRAKDEQLAVRASEVGHLQGQLQNVAGNLRERDAAVDLARAAFSRELEGLRKAIDLTEERARATERRAMNDVEIARAALKKCERALTEQQRRAAADAKRLETGITKRDHEVQSLRERLARTEAVATSSKQQLERAEATLTKLLRASNSLSKRKQPLKRQLPSNHR